MTGLKVKPWRQGSLDALCGAYAVIDAIQLATPGRRLNGADGVALLGMLITNIQKHECLATVLADGLSRRAVCRSFAISRLWLRQQYQLNLAVHWPYYRNPAVATNTILTTIRSHLARPGSAVLIGFIGEVNHWTVVRTVSNGRIELFDSNGRKFLRRTSCGEWNDDAACYRLEATATALISISPID